MVAVAVAVDAAEARGGGESLPTSRSDAAACCASAIWRTVLGRSVRGPRVKGSLAKVQDTPAATHAGQGGIPEHLILRTLQPSQARLLILRPGADIAAVRLPLTAGPEIGSRQRIRRIPQFFLKEYLSGREAEA